MNRQSNKITALYCRLAHYNKDSDLPIARNQQEILLKYAIEHGLESPCFYCDWGFSGTTFDRPEFQSMLREVKAGNVANLVVKDLSRLGRGCMACGDLVETTFPKYGVTVYSIQDGILAPKYHTEMANVKKGLLTLYRKSQRGGRT